jgi:hypothetical protein
MKTRQASLLGIAYSFRCVGRILRGATHCQALQAQIQQATQVQTRGEG